jgi:hypothetical protein
MQASLAARLGALCLGLSIGCASPADARPPASPPRPRPLEHEPANVSHLGKVSAPRWLASLPSQPPPRRDFPIDPRKASYYEEVVAALQLTAEERELLRKNGFVIVDHDARHTFASVYRGIFVKDLPVLVTTDSVLHAYHRSYDYMLRTLEEQWLAGEVQRLLGDVRGRLAASAKLDAIAVRDVDDYLRVALALLADPNDTRSRTLGARQHDDDQVEVLVNAAMAAGGPASLRLRGHERLIDFSQFTPRGHYTGSPLLSRYFRAMMWLGRADTGFWLTAGDASLRLDLDPDRELRAAALLARLVRESDAAQSYAHVDAVYRMLVGRSDNLTVEALAEADESARGSLDALRERLLQHPDAEQKIQSSLHFVERGSAPRAELPVLFQLIGQRYTIDADVLAQVVHDRIVVDGVAVPRMMPSPLDVAAALGNDEAARLLEPELEKYGYADQLASLRRGIALMPEAAWSESLATGWLAALRALHPGTVEASKLPAAMNSTAWQRKMLGSELASWSELRHDNVLVTKESYTMGIACEYPYGYVEPYPAFYARLAGLAEKTAKVLFEHVRGPQVQRLSDYGFHHFNSFAETMRTLEQLARKQLAAKKFDKDDQKFMKNLIVEAGGCGGPEVAGWYPRLYPGSEDPLKWEPTVAAVHTSPADGRLDILHAGVGDTRYLVAVIDSEGDASAYVGPVYSYYESVEHRRLTDEAWRERLRTGKQPAQPSWLAELGGPPRKRQIAH